MKICRKTRGKHQLVSMASLKDCSWSYVLSKVIDICDSAFNESGLEFTVVPTSKELCEDGNGETESIYIGCAYIVKESHYRLSIVTGANLVGTAMCEVAIFNGAKLIHPDEFESFKIYRTDYPIVRLYDKEELQQFLAVFCRRVEDTLYPDSE